MEPEVSGSSRGDLVDRAAMEPEVSGSSRGDLVAYKNATTSNWAGNVEFAAATVSTPTSISDLQAVVKNAPGLVRVVGRGHSFSPVCECEGGTLLSLSSLNRVVSFEPPVCVDGQMTRCGRVCVEGGTTYTEVIHYLSGLENPCALKMLASVTQATVAGACATGTHGSGIHNQNLASAVTAIELVTASGELVTYDRSCAEFMGAVTNVGCLGVVSKITVDVVPVFEGKCVLYTLPIEVLIDNWDQLPPLCDAFSVLCFFHTGVCLLLLKHFSPHWDSTIARPMPEYGEHLFGAGHLGDENGLFPGVTEPRWAGPWHDTVPVFMSDGAEHDLGDAATNNCGQQVELFVPIEHATAALRATRDILKGWPVADSLSPETAEEGILYHTELRVVKGDPSGQWLSPHPVDSLCIHLNLNGRPHHLAEINRRLGELESTLGQFGARPHWGKLVSTTPTSGKAAVFTPERLQALLGDKLVWFRELAVKLDPAGKFRNKWVTGLLFDEA